MEITYAQALAKMIAKGMNPKEAVLALRQLLVRRGREKLLPKIGRAFKRIAERERARTGMVLTVAREKDHHHAQKEAKELLGEMNLDADIPIKIDESLIGGWRLEGGELLVDASFKKYLLSLYNRATQS